jgi:hypothetical protein
VLATPLLFAHFCVSERGRQVGSAPVGYGSILGSNPKLELPGQLFRWGQLSASLLKQLMTNHTFKSYKVGARLPCFVYVSFSEFLENELIFKVFVREFFKL